MGTDKKKILILGVSKVLTDPEILSKVIDLGYEVHYTQELTEKEKLLISGRGITHNKTLIDELQRLSKYVDKHLPVKPESKFNVRKPYQQSGSFNQSKFESTRRKKRKNRKNKKRR